MSIEAAVLRADVQVTGAQKAQGDLGGVDRSVERTGQGLGGLADGLKGAAAGFAAFEGVKFLGDVIGDAEKTNQEVQTTIHLFGSAGDAVVEWSKTTASSMGLSEQATLGMVDGLGTMLTGFGLTGGAAKAMSEKLVALSVDVGAFMHKDPSTVLASFQKGLTGAAKGLKTYGVDTSVAAQKQEALALGLNTSASSWTAAQKAAIFYQLILKGTAQEVGTFAQRSGDLTESQAKLKAEFANLKDEIGSGLLPEATALFGVFDQGFSAIGPGATEAIGKIIGIGAVTAAGTVGVLAFAKGWGILTEALTAETVAVDGAEAANIGLLASIGPLGWTALAVGAALGALTAITSVFGQHQKDAGKSTNDFIDSLLQEGTTISGVADQLVEKGVASNKGFADSFKAINIPLSTVTKALEGNKTAVLAVGNAVKDGVETGKISIDQAGKLDGWLTKNAKSLHDRTQAQSESNAATRELAAASQSATSAVDALRAADVSLTTATLANRDALRSQKEGLLGLVGNTISYKQNLLSVHDAYVTWLKDVKAGHANTEQGQKDLLALQSAQNTLATGTLTSVDAAEKLALSESHVTEAQKALTDANKKLASGKGSQQDVTDATNVLYDAQQKEKQALINNAQFMTGPARQAALDLAAGIKTIPDTKATAYTTPGLPEAQGGVKSYNLLLHNVSPSEATHFIADTAAAQAQVAAYVQTIHSIPGIVTSVFGIKKSAGGNPLAAGELSWVGENGPELFQAPPGGGRVIPHAQSMALAESLAGSSRSTSGGSGATFQFGDINVSVGMGTHPAQVGAAVIDAIQSAVRNGKLIPPETLRAFART